MKNLKITSAFVFAISLLFSCSKTSSGGDAGPSPSDQNSGLDFQKYSPDCFKKQSSSAILARGDLFSGATWNDPHVIKEGSTFVMYASADTNFDGNIQIYRLISSDGIRFSLSPSTPVLSKSSGGSDWDRKSVETPAVVKFKDLYYMFYTGYPVTGADPKSYKIGYATSLDGINWTKQVTQFGPTAPANNTPNLEFNQWVVAEPAPVVFQDKIYLYFTALGADMSVGTTLQTIGLTTFDGANWSSMKKVLSPDQSIYPRTANWKGYSTPHAAVLNGNVHLFFSVVNDASGDHPMKIHHAVSANGESSWKTDSTPIFDRADFSPWTSQDIRAPAVLLDGTNLHLWFAGNGSTANFPNVSMGIGAASCSLK